jgi:putative addiction module component (TIGR02574 family)
MKLVMDPEVQRILDQARLLPPIHRAALAASILESLDGEPEPDAERAWEAELDRRQAELKEGRVRAVPWDEARKQMFGDTCPPES